MSRLSTSKNRVLATRKTDSLGVQDDEENEVGRSSGRLTKANTSYGNRALGAGLTLAVSVGLFAFGGLWIDRQLGTRPWFLLLMVLLGIAGGMLHLIKTVAPDMWPFGRLDSNDKQ
ncbi:MAG TPA: AtpZ/AtpI family protein [bacterium]|nr:AtpZ/AtpI family protein [bacterium]